MTSTKKKIAIGILSMQKVLNYGSFLQAYGLKKTLLSLGADTVEYIDIIPGKQFKEIRTRPLVEKAKRIFGIVCKILTNRPSKINELIRFRRYYPKSITDSWGLIGIAGKNINHHFDIAVIGSDEVFNCCNRNEWGFSHQLFGDIRNAKICVSYAASFGSTTIEAIEHYGIKYDLSKLLCNFDKISVRDKNSFNIISQLTGKHPFMHIDPVLLYDFSKEIELANENVSANYIIIYTYPGRIHDKKEIDAICDFARKKKKKLLTIMCSYKWSDGLIIPASPFGVLKWFKNADYVITDTFHGSIFSIITGRNFVSLIRDTNANKLGFLLEQFGLKSRIVTPEVLGSVLNEEIDYVSVYNLRDKLKYEAIKYLSGIISSAN